MYNQRYLVTTWRGGLRGLPQFLAWVKWRMMVALSGVETQGLALWGDYEFILGHAGFEVHVVEPMDKSPRQLATGIWTSGKTPD